jgi:hypothetical protein
MDAELGDGQTRRSCFLAGKFASYGGAHLAVNWAFTRCTHERRGARGCGACRLRRLLRAKRYRAPSQAGFAKAPAHEMQQGMHVRRAAARRSSSRSRSAAARSRSAAARSRSAAARAAASTARAAASAARAVSAASARAIAAFSACLRVCASTACTAATAESPPAAALPPPAGGNSGDGVEGPPPDEPLGRLGGPESPA